MRGILRMQAFMLAFICMLFIENASADARSYCLIDMDSGRVLYEKNADARYAIASTTKIMTCLIALEACSMDETVTAGENAYGVYGTSIYLQKGETLTMKEMLYGLMLRSGNDAAVAISEHVAGSAEAFCNIMNARASQIGADAYFTNPHGLDEGGNGASARGLSLIAREAMKNEQFRQIVQTEKMTIPWANRQYERVLTNKNKLLKTYEGATGIKTGYTNKAGRCLAFSAERGNFSVVGCVLNCPDWFNEAALLLDQAFREYTVKVFYEKGQVIKSFDIFGQKINVGAEEDVRIPLKENESAEVIIECNKIELPVCEGQTAGKVRILIDGEEAAEYKLVYLNPADAHVFSSAVRKVISCWMLM